MTQPPRVLRFLHPLLASSALTREPVRVEIAGHPFVLFRDREGRVAALTDACPHRLAPLSKGRVRPDGRLMCAYHGWHFDAEGRGVCPSGATLAKCDTTSLRAIERHGYVWVCSRDAGELEPPSFDRDGFEPTGAFSVRMPAPLHVALDNFSENEHVPFVHTRLGWDDASMDTVEFEAHNFDDRTEVRYRARQRFSPIVWLLTLRRGDLYANEWVTRFDPVRTEYTLHWTDASGQTQRPFASRATIYMVPETAKTTWFHVFIGSKILNPRYRIVAPIVRRAALVLGRWEVEDDARFLPVVAETPEDLTGMRLGKFDKPLIHNRKLLRSLYWGNVEPLALVR